MDRRLAMAVVALLAPAGLSTQSAVAAPSNDSPFGAGVFAPYPGFSGTPTEQEATADLATANADAGVPRCLGRTSFARTVWYRIPEDTTARVLTVEATGRTADPIDLAAFVQPRVFRRRQTTLNLHEPNACDGYGAGAGADSPDRSSAVSLLVPPGHPTLIQVGRRGPVGTQADEAALLNLDALPVTLEPRPRGDVADTAPRMVIGTNPIDLAGAAITPEDPAQPACASLATVWRKLVPGAAGSRLISVSGQDATSFTVFAGKRPTGDNALDCVNRRERGAMQMLVPVKRNQPVWVRVGSDRIEGDEEAVVTVSDGAHRTVIDGGPGGFDPTPFGIAGGLPVACDRADADQATVIGPDLRGRAADYNRFVRVPVTLEVSDSYVCDVTVRLLGPGGHLYARGRYVRLRTGRQRIGVPRRISFRPGRYRLEVRGRDARGKQAIVTTDVTGRLRPTPPGR